MKKLVSLFFSLNLIVMSVFTDSAHSNSSKSKPENCSQALESSHVFQNPQSATIKLVVLSSKFSEKGYLKVTLRDTEYEQIVIGLLIDRAEIIQNGVPQYDQMQKIKLDPQKLIRIKDAGLIEHFKSYGESSNPLLHPFELYQYSFK